MTISRTKKLAGAAAAAGLLVALAGCGAAPEAAPSGDASDGGEATSDFKACMVSDAGGFDDKSFNQLGLEGLTAASEELGFEIATTESQSESDYAANLDNLAAEGCNFIVSVGFLLSAPTVEAALANPEIEYAIIDDYADNDFDGETDAPNIKPLVFDTAQAAFLAGYASASYSESGIVGTFGGAKIPPVTIFMDGFQMGVEYWNEQKGEDVQVVGWDMETQEGQFTEEFLANDTAKQVARASSTRAPTCSCRSVARSTSRPLRRSVTRAATSRCSVSTPTCTRPTRASPTCCWSRCSRAWMLR